MVKWIASLLVTLMLVVGIVSALLLSSVARNTPAASLPPGAYGPSGQPPASSPPGPLTPDSLSYGDPSTPPPTSPGQSRLWFYADVWWGVFLSADTGDQRIYRLDPLSTWVDTGVVVDERTFARVDVISEGETVFVASAGPQPKSSNALLIVRFSYDATVRGYVRDANFPLPITSTGVDNVTIARTDDGGLWVAYRVGKRMAVDHTLGSDLAWGGAIAPTAANVPVENVAIVSLGDRVAVAWTSPGVEAVSMAWRDITGPDDDWDRSPDAPVAGLGLGDDQLSLATDRSPGAERVFAAVKTSADAGPDRSRFDPQVVMVEFTAGGSPTSYLFGRIDEKHAGPIIVLNSETRAVTVIAASPESGGSIYYKTTSLDRISFDTGPGIELISATDAHPRLAQPTSTKQALDTSTGFVVAATDSSVGLYAFGAVGLRERPASVPTASPASPASAPLINSTFDGLLVGADVPGWVLDGDPTASFTIRVLTGSNSSARLSGATAGSRACTPFAEVSTGSMRIEADVLFNMVSDQELRLMQVRGDAGELAAVRLRNGEVVYGDGTTRIRSGLVLAPGHWYRSVLTLDLAARTYGLELRDVASGTLMLQDEELAWRAVSTVVNRICAELPAVPGLDLYLDNVLVTSTIARGN